MSIVPLTPVEFADREVADDRDVLPSQLSKRSPGEVHRRPGVVALGQRDAVLQRGGGGEGLEGRAGLEALGAAHLARRRVVPVGLALLGVRPHHRPALRHGHDLAGARLDHVHDRDDRVLGADRGADLLLHRVLRVAGRSPVRIVRPPCISSFSPVGRRSCPGSASASTERRHVVADERVVGALAAARQVLDLAGGELRLLRLGRPPLALAVPSSAIRSSTTLRRSMPASGWVTGSKPFGFCTSPASIAACGSVSFLARGAEVVLRGGLDAVRAVAEVGDVQVALEDLVLAHRVLDGHGVAQLAELALVAAVGGGLDGRPRSPLSAAALTWTCLTYCWVSVDPPWVTPPAKKFLTNARSVPWASRGPCS